MGRGLNKITLIGNVGADPEIRSTSDGTRIAKLSLATNRSYKDASGAKREETEWHRLTAFDRLADVIEQYVKKGDRIYAEGRMHYSQTEDETGHTRYWSEVIMRELVMLGGDREREPDPVRRDAERMAADDAPF